MKFPKAVDYHKLDKHLVPNGLGIIYVLASVAYLFTLYTFDVTGSLPLASCILLGGFLGLADDWINVPWRYKAFLPLITSIPLVALKQGDTSMATYLWGSVDFGILYYLFIIPAIVIGTTNSINMLGGLHGLETVCPLIIMVTLAFYGSINSLLLTVPIIVLFLLSIYNLRGKVFVGNTGSFAVGATLASYTIIANIEQTLLIALLPYIFNSVLILWNYFRGKIASLKLLDNGKLTSTHMRSLPTIMASLSGQATEEVLVLEISLLIAHFCTLACLVGYISWV